MLDSPSMPASKLQPALLGGLFIGVLSALPIISAGNCFCCMWVIGGGVVAAYLLQQNQAAPIASADGAITGIKEAPPKRGFCATPADGNGDPGL